jgi:WD40 repeat protein
MRKQTVKIWDVNGALLRGFEANDSEGQVATFSASGRTVAVAHDHAIEIRSVESGALLLSLVAFTDGNWLAFTPDGYFSGSTDVGKDATVRLGTGAYELGQFVDTLCKPGKVAAVLDSR